MDKDRGFNFKLLVPPRLARGQVSAVRPQEVVEDSGLVKHTIQQGYNTCIDKALSNASMVVPTKPGRQDIPNTRVGPSIENDEQAYLSASLLNIPQNNSGQLYTMLFDEVDKIKSWKGKMDLETMKKENRLQENRRTIETQRKAIQELQFENEGLSIKLEEQINENEDLRNKNNATRNLCNLLKDTFDRSAEKIHLFESEREETHHLFLENSESIQGMITAFENLRVQAEADQHEMLKVKEGLLQFEELKEKVQQEYIIKYNEVEILKTKLEEKKEELEKLLLKLHKTQESCKQLQEENGQHSELLKSSKYEQDSLLQKLEHAEKLCEETESNLASITSALEQNKEEYQQLNQKKDLKIEELSKVKDQQAKTLVEMHAVANERESSLTSEMERGKELELKLESISMEMGNTMVVLELKEELHFVEEAREQSRKKDEQIKVAEDELKNTSKSLDLLWERNKCIEAKVQEITAELSRANEEAKLYKDLQERECLTAEKAHNELKEKASMAEEKVQEVESRLLTETEKRRVSTSQMEQLKKDIMQHEIRYGELLSRFNDVHSEKKTIQEQFDSGCFDTVKLEEKLKDEDLQDKITKKEKQIKVMEAKLCNLKTKYEAKSKTQEECNKENKTLKRQMAKEIERCGQLENEMNYLKEECGHMKREKEEEHQRLLEVLGVKTTMAAELENEVQILKLTASEANKNKEDVELKCQHKIADMVALMEKHKNQYDEMVKEKDAELEENKKNEKEAVARRSALELELSQNKIENDGLKKDLKKEMKEKDHLQTELHELKKDISSLKISQQSEAKSKTLKLNYGCGCTENIETLKETNIRTKRTACKNEDRGSSTIANIQDIVKEDLKTPSWSTGAIRRLRATPKIKSYRIRTPPSVERSAPWRKGSLELDPKSDSSEHNDLLTFANEPGSRFSATQRKVNIFKAIQSPAVYKSPGKSLKMAAIKRMRDAGWTTVTGSDRKKKKDQKVQVVAAVVLSGGCVVLLRVEAWLEALAAVDPKVVPEPELDDDAFTCEDADQQANDHGAQGAQRGKVQVGQGVQAVCQSRPNPERENMFTA
ncbi:Synaptonemal complex protein 1 [Merluccius polli]|uniref:Synaptonemal complex protein 1 n=1 Tax=Merluccius polli TaxID=89951 RepID=A0AA47MAN2_MERPO|nr:Synaptonemal complex protein 1 [Merluccius polli]